MNNQQAVSQNQMSIADQSQPGSLAGLTSGVTKAWEAIMSLMQTVVSEGEKNTSVDTNQKENTYAGYKDYGLIITVFPAEKEQITVAEAMNYSFPTLELPLKDDTYGSSIEKSYVYGNIAFLAVRMKSEFVTNPDISEKTKHVTAIVETLLGKPAPKFLWSALNLPELRDLDLPRPEGEELWMDLLGTSGGANFGA